VKSFIQKHEQDVMGTLSGFDRLVFRGILRRLFYPQGMDYCLAFLGVLLKDFVPYVLQVTARLKEASLAAARRAGRPIQYLASSQIRKDDLARKIAARDRLTDGLILCSPAWSPVKPLKFTATGNPSGSRFGLIAANACTSITIFFIPSSAL